MTFNNIIELLQSIASAHYQIKGFGFGNIFEINKSVKPGLNYPLLWAVPLSSVTKDQTKERSYLLLVVGLSKKDQSDRDEVWSDTEQIFDDIIKILRQESNDYTLINEPQADPVCEEFSDWVTGWQGEIVIETDLNSNYCDIPADGLSKPVKAPGYVIIKDQYGNTVTELRPGETYTVTVLDTIQQSLDTVQPTIIQVLS